MPTSPDPQRFEQYLEDNGDIGEKPPNVNTATRESSIVNLKTPPNTITFWSNYAMKSTVGDRSVAVGVPSGNSSTLRLSIGQKCDSASIWTAKDSSFNGIRVVSGNQTLKAGPCTGTEHPLNMGSGLLVGLKASASVEGNPTRIYSVNLMFLKPVKYLASKITKIELPHGRQGIYPVAVDSYNFTNRNPGKSNEMWNWTSSVSKHTTTSWHQNASLTFGASMSVSGGVPGIIGVSDSAQWSITAGISHDQTESVDKNLNWNVSGTVKYGESVHCVALSQEGKVDVDYESEVTVTLVSGQAFTFEETGRFKRVDYSSVSVQTN